MNTLKIVLVSKFNEHSSALFLRLTSYITICVCYGMNIHSVPFTTSLSTAAVMGCPDRYRQTSYATELPRWGNDKRDTMYNNYTVSEM